MAGRVLVAGIGNIFLGDDGFGVEVVQRLMSRELPQWVKIADFGIRGMHLAYELLDGDYDTTILVDATPQGDIPGTVYLIEPDFTATDSIENGRGIVADAHGMTPGAVFSMLKTLGGVPGRVLIVGCEPMNVDEGMGLSDPVNAAVEDAMTLVIDVLGRDEIAGKRVRDEAGVADGFDHLEIRSG